MAIINRHARQSTTFLCYGLFKILVIALCFISTSVFSANKNDQLTIIEQARIFHKEANAEALLALVEPVISDDVFSQTDRLEVLNMIVHSYIYKGQIERAAEVNNQLRMESDESGNNLYLGKSFLNDGEVLQRRGMFNEALQKQRQALHYYRQANNKKFMANALLEISYSLEELHRNVEALDYATQSLTIGEEIEDIHTIASAYNSIGMVHDNLGNFELALKAHQKTIKLDRELGDFSELATSYYNVANIFIKMGNLKQAEFYSKEALKLDLPGGNPDFLGHDYSRLGDLALRMDNPEKAKEYALTAKSYFESYDSIGELGSVHNLLAKVYHSLGEANLSDFHLEEAININTRLDNLNQLTRSYIYKSEILFDRGEFANALNLIDTTLPVLIEQKDFDGIKTLFMLKSRVYEALNDEVKALEAYKNYYMLKDEFDAENRTTILAQLQNQMDFLHKEHRIDILETQSSIRQLQLERARLEKNLWITGLILCVLLVATFLYRERTKRLLAAMEKEFLASSIEQKNAMLAEVAHELRSPLTALKLQVESLQYNLEDDPDAAYHRLNNKVTELNELIEDLYDLARADNGLLKLNKESVSVYDLVEDITQGYQEVVEHRGLELKTQLQVKESDCFTVDSHRIKQVIVNLIRNSINYTNAPGTICCTAKTQDCKCEIILEDSAPGVPNEEIPRLFERMYRADDTRDKHESGSGLGLSICKSLVEAHGGEIKASTSQLGGLRVKISLPMNKVREAA